MEGVVKYYVVWILDEKFGYYFREYCIKFNNDFIQIKKAMTERFSFNPFNEINKKYAEKIKNIQEAKVLKVTNGEILEL